MIQNKLWISVCVKSHTREVTHTSCAGLCGSIDETAEVPCGAGR